VLARAPVDLGQIISQVTQELRLLSAQHRIGLELPATPIVIAGDAVRLEQVIDHLVLNAIKYSPTGGTTTVMATHPDDESAVVTVSDEGVGSPVADLPTILERFARASNVETTSISGLGLGLHRVKEWVALHGGTVEATSIVGQGSTFRITLPRQA
jgi:signal transduction histidine kinase